MSFSLFDLTPIRFKNESSPAVATNNHDAAHNTNIQMYQLHVVPNLPLDLLVVVIKSQQNDQHQQHRQ